MQRHKKELNIKNLGKVKGELFHRHFGENTFRELLKKKNVDEVVIITYVGLSSAENNLKHIIQTFTGKTNSLTVVLGITWNKVKNKETRKYELPEGEINKYNVFMSYIRGLSLKGVGDTFENINIYIHSRCHIKAVYADNETYFGSQNFAKTAQSFSENKKYPNLLNYHELVIKIEDYNGEQVKSLLDEVINDKQNCELILSSEQIEFTGSLQELDERRIVEAIKNEIKRLNDLKTQFHDITSIIKEFELAEIEFVEILKVDQDSLISLFEKVSNSNSYKEAIESLEKIFAIYTGEYEFQSPLETNEKCIAIKSRLDDFSSLLEGLTDQINSNLFDIITEKVQEVIDGFEELELPEISNVSVFEECYGPILEVLSNSDVYDLSTFNNTYIDDMNNSAQGSPGDVSSEFLDNDGNLTTFLSVEDLPSSAIGEVHNEVSNEVGYKVIELLYTPIQEYFSDWHENILDNFQEIEAYLNEIQCSFEEESYSRIE